MGLFSVSMLTCTQQEVGNNYFTRKSFSNSLFELFQVRQKKILALENQVQLPKTCALSPTIFIFEPHWAPIEYL